MYDSVPFGQVKSAHSFPRWSGRCQGRRTLALISTLDTVPATSTIEVGSNLGRISEIRTIAGKRSFVAKRPKLAP